MPQSPTGPAGPDRCGREGRTEEEWDLRGQRLGLGIGAGYEWGLMNWCSILSEYVFALDIFGYLWIPDAMEIPTEGFM